MKDDDTRGLQLTRREFLGTGAALAIALAGSGCASAGTVLQPRRPEMVYDVLIVGGGPAGLAAALTLGRARKRVLICDGGAPRNETADQINGFVTRDGNAPTALATLYGNDRRVV